MSDTKSTTPADEPAEEPQSQPGFGWWSAIFPAAEYEPTVPPGAHPVPWIGGTGPLPKPVNK